MKTNLFTAGIINQLLVAGMERLSSINRIEYNFVTDNNLGQNRMSIRTVITL